MSEDQSLPAPPCEPLDLRYFAVAEIDPSMIVGPAFSGLSAEGFRAQVMLALAAWREVPAGSLSPCETTLALLAGFGRDLSAWVAVRQEVLAHWDYCNDGRLWFEPMVPAIEAAGARLKSNRLSDSRRKARQRMRRELRDAGVTMPDAELDVRLDEAVAAVRARGGAGLRGRARAEAVRHLASEMGLLPRAGGDLAPRFGAELRPVGAAAGGHVARMIRERSE